VRRVRPGEHPALTELALRSKAHWGYPPDLLEAWRTDLTVPADGDEVWVVDGDDGTPAGVLVLDDGEVDMLFVDPAAMGRGIGRALWDHAVRRARDLGWPDLLSRRTRTPSVSTRAWARPSSASGPLPSSRAASSRSSGSSSTDAEPAYRPLSAVEQAPGPRNQRKLSHRRRRVTATSPFEQPNA